MNEYIKTIRRKIGHDMLMIAGAGVVVHKDGMILLQKRRDNGFWGIHGGAVEVGETVEAAARRELLEETGLTAGNMEFLGVFSGKDMLYTYPNGDQVSIVSIAYTCRDFSGKLMADGEETAGFGWFDAKSLPMELNPADRPVLEAFVRGRDRR